MGHYRLDQDGETVVRIEGVLDAVTAPELRPLINALVEDRCQLVTVDLSSLRLIDSSGVAALVSLYKRLLEQGGHACVVGVCGQPLAIFNLLGLGTYFSPAGETVRRQAAAAFLTA
jgi:anti-sigma B factor antagonist